MSGRHFLLQHLLSACPRQVKMALLKGICAERGAFDNAFGILTELAPACGVAELIVEGEYGAIQSAATDSVVLGTYAKTGRWAHRTNSLLVDFFKKAEHGTYLDVGANIGLTTIPLACNRNVRCLAFEPEPINFANLRANVTANCTHGNVVLYQLAVLCGKNSRAVLELSSNNLGDHRIRTASMTGTVGKTAKAISVDAAALDDVAGEISHPLAIKIDTQGAEPLVFAGGPLTISQADLLIAEWWPYGMSTHQRNLNIVTNMLKANFRRMRIGPGEEGQLGPYLAAEAGCDYLLEVATKYRHDSDFYVDVVAERER
jgi:FkbM family methyltransferase